MTEKRQTAPNGDARDSGDLFHKPGPSRENLMATQMVARMTELDSTERLNAYYKCVVVPFSRHFPQVARDWLKTKYDARMAALAQSKEEGVKE